MDLDAVITFKRVLKEKEIKMADKMLLLSAINNRNIDINLSIKENLNLINKDGIAIEELFLYLKEFIGDKEPTDDVPIYMLFLEKSALWDLLISAYKKSNLREEAVLAIGEAIFKYLDNEEIHNNEELLVFLNSILSVRKPADYLLFQRSFSIEPFIYAIIDEIYNDGNSAKKSLLITLITFGYIDFYLLNRTVDDSYSYIESFIKELLDHELYAYVKIFINSRTVNRDLAVVIKDILGEYVSPHGYSHRLELLIDHINNKLDTIIQEEKPKSRH